LPWSLQDRLVIHKKENRIDDDVEIILALVREYLTSIGAGLVELKSLN
jgi:hypothetical protein